MPTTVKFRRGTTAQNDAFTGAAGELTVNETLDTVVVHDGSTAGGFTVVNETATQTLTNKTLTSPTITSPSITGTGSVAASTVNATTLQIGGTSITSTATELNILDGVTATASELNTMDGITATASELNTMDGITASTAELNTMDGITATTTELNYVDGVTSAIQTQLDVKAPLASPALTGTATAVNLTISGDLTVNGTTTTVASTNTVVSDNLIELNNGAASNANDSGIVIERGSTGDNAFMGWDESADSFVLGTTTATGASTGDLTITAAPLSISSLTLGGTAITSTAAELNILDGVTATAAELNIMDGVTATTAELNKMDGVTATTTELNYVDGVTSAIQTQLDAKAATSSLGSLATLSTVNADTITDNSVGAAELNVTGNGTTAQFLRSDGDGTFTWATPTDTNTTYSAGAGLDLTSTTFSVESDLRGDVYYIGRDTNDYYLVNTTTHDWYLDGVLDMRLENDGDLHVDGDVVADSATTSSDEKLKTGITTVTNALDKIAQLDGVEFTWKKDGTRSAGVIAQTVEKVLPYAVKEVNDLKTDEPYKTVNYNNLHSLYIEAIKELKAEIEELKKNK